MQDHFLKLVAVKFIQEGSEISSHYVSSIHGTFRRQLQLQNKWYFACKCKRCLDQVKHLTFLQVLLNNLICTTSILETVNVFAWKCKRCLHPVNIWLINKFFSIIEAPMSLGGWGWGGGGGGLLSPFPLNLCQRLPLSISEENGWYHLEFSQIWKEIWWIIRVSWGLAENEKKNTRVKDC